MEANGCRGSRQILKKLSAVIRLYGGRNTSVVMLCWHEQFVPIGAFLYLDYFSYVIHELLKVHWTVKITCRIRASTQKSFCFSWLSKHEEPSGGFWGKEMFLSREILLLIKTLIFFCRLGFRLLGVNTSII